MRQLLSLDFFKVTDKDIYKLRNKLPSRLHMDRRLPKYALTKYGIVETENHLQYIGFDELPTTNNEYILFNINYVSSLLNEEISNSGFESLLRFSNIKLNYNSFMNNFRMNKIDDCIYIETIIVMDIEYQTDGEYELKLIGYLDDKMELVSNYDLLYMKEKL